MDKSDTIGELAKALAKAQAQFGPLIKGAANPFYKSKYADLASVADIARIPLSENELCYSQLTDESEAGFIIVETLLVHSSGEWIMGRLKMPLQKLDPQGYGSAFTYARRYSLQAILGLAAEDDDAEGAMSRKGDEPVRGAPKSGKPSQSGQPSKNPPTVRGIVKEVSVKKGSKEGKQWTRYGVLVNDQWFGTFSQTIGEAAESCKGAEVVISYSEEGEHKTIIEIVPVPVRQQ